MPPFSQMASWAFVRPLDDSTRGISGSLAGGNVGQHVDPRRVNKGRIDHVVAARFQLRVERLVVRCQPKERILTERPHRCFSCSYVPRTGRRGHALAPIHTLAHPPSVDFRGLRGRPSRMQRIEEALLVDQVRRPRGFAPTGPMASDYTPRAARSSATCFGVTRGSYRASTSPPPLTRNLV